MSLSNTGKQFLDRRQQSSRKRTNPSNDGQQGDLNAVRRNSLAAHLPNYRNQECSDRQVRQRRHYSQESLLLTETAGRQVEVLSVQVNRLLQVKCSGLASCSCCYPNGLEIGRAEGEQVQMVTQKYDSTPKKTVDAF